MFTSARVRAAHCIVSHQIFVRMACVQWFAIRSSNTKSQSLHETNHYLFLFPCTQKRLRLVIQAAGWDMPCKYIKWKHETFFRFLWPTMNTANCCFDLFNIVWFFHGLIQQFLCSKTTSTPVVFCSLCDNWTQQVTGLADISPNERIWVWLGCPGVLRTT